MDLNDPARREGTGTGRAVELVAGDFLLTVNPVDGSQIEPCPPGRRPIVPRRAPSLTGPDGTPSAPLLDRDDERHRLHRFLSRGRSVRLTAPPGAGRSALLAAVARDCADLAPDGVIRLSGYRRTPEDLLHELYAAVHHTPAYRPGSTELAAALRVIGAVVVVDDLEFGGAALDELLDATPECAFLLAAHPEVPGPENPSRVEEAELTGLDLDACLELLRRALGRALEPAEADWAAGVWRDTGGLPRRFAQAAGVAGSRPPADRLAAALADGSPEAGREILRYAVALGGELPGPERLAAMTGNPGAPAAHGDLLTHGLIGIAGPRHRLAPGVQGELLAAGYGEGSADRLHTAAQHYAWWLSRPEATHADAAEEAEALLAVATAALRAGHAAAVSALARAAAPLLAAGPRWGIWEGMLHVGLEAAGAAEELAQQAYFRHELGVLAILHGRFDRARDELEASTELHSAVEDTGGLLMDRRALALVTDLTTPPARAALLPVPAPIGPPPPPAVGAEDQTQVIPRQEAAAPGDPATTELPPVLPYDPPARPRRPVLAIVAGGMILAGLGTFVALGLASGDGGSEDSRPRPALVDDRDPALPSTGEEETDGPTRESSPSTSPSDTADPDPGGYTPPPDTGLPPTGTTPEDTATPTDPPTTPPTEPPSPGSGGSSTTGGTDAGGADAGGADAGGADPGGTDAGTDQGADAGTDAGTDAGAGGADTGTDQGTDTGTDQGTDAGADQGGDAGAEAAAGGAAAP